MQTIINFCPTGMIPTKDMTPHVPVSIQEIVEQTHEAYDIGITMVHLHARDQRGKPTYKKDVYAKIIEGVRKYCPELIVGISTSGRDFPELEKRSEVLELMPDTASLTLSSLNFQKSASVNSPEVIDGLLTKMIEYGVHPELEVFDLGMINFGKYILHKKGLTGPQYWNLLFGNIAGMQPTFSEIGVAVDRIPEGHYISFAGLGSHQKSTNAIAVAAGFGVRVGIEDNIWLDRNRTIKATNSGLVKQIHHLMEYHERTLLTSQQMGFYNKKNG